MMTSRCRSLDINIDNEVERMHAIRLVRKLMQINASKLPQSLVSVVISIASGGIEEKDKLHKVCLSILCELGKSHTSTATVNFSLVFNILFISLCLSAALSSPCLVCRRGGLAALLHNVLRFSSLNRLTDSLVGVALHLLNQPCSRHLIKPDIGIEVSCCY